MAVIRVGGATEVEVKERKDRVDDAMHATRAAVEEGIVAGGGVALFYAIKALEASNRNNDQKVGVEIVRKALQAPARQIAENAGVDGSIVIGKMLRKRGRQLRLRCADRRVWRPRQEGHHRSGQGRPRALQDAASVAGLLITTEAMIAEKPKSAAHACRWRHGWHGRHGWRDGLLTYSLEGQRTSCCPCLVAFGLQ